MILTLITTLLVNYFLLYHELGLGAFLTVIVCILYVAYDAYKKNNLNKQFYIKSAIILCMATTFIIRDFLVFKVLTFLALPLLFTFFFIEFKEFYFLTKWNELLLTFLRPIGKLHLFIKDMTKHLFKNNEKLRYVLVGVLIAIPFLSIIIPLLISSDLILESLTIDFIDGIELSAEWIFRIMFFLIFSGYIYGQTRLPFVKDLATTPLKTSDFENNQDEETIIEKENSHTGRSTIMLTFLGIINFTYGVYVFIQIKYLFLNLGKLPDGLTYAEYARAGFFELLTVAIINVMAIILLERLNHQKLLPQRILENLTLIFTLIMSISAFYRMSLYESSYGYTSLRMLVFMFLVFLMIVIILLIFYIFTYKNFLLNTLVLFMIVYYIGSSWFNIDNFVAQQNINRYETKDEIDVNYLLNLSDDAYDLVTTFLDDNPDLEPSTTYGFRNSSDKNKSSWQAWNFQKR